MDIKPNIENRCETCFGTGTRTEMKPPRFARASGVRGLLIYCSDYRCSHSIAISADQWPDHVRLSDLEGRFICKACGTKGADVRPDWQGV